MEENAVRSHVLFEDVPRRSAASGSMTAAAVKARFDPGKCRRRGGGGMLRERALACMLFILNLSQGAVVKLLLNMEERFFNIFFYLTVLPATFSLASSHLSQQAWPGF